MNKAEESGLAHLHEELQKHTDGVVDLPNGMRWQIPKEVETYIQDLINEIEDLDYIADQVNDLEIQILQKEGEILELQHENADLESELFDLRNETC